MFECVFSVSFIIVKGDCWFGYIVNCVVELSGSMLCSYGVYDGLQIGCIWVICGGGDFMWLGGEIGLLMFLYGCFYIVVVFGVLVLGIVCGIIFSCFGGLWLNELYGVVYIDVVEVSVLQVDFIYVVKVELFDYLDGLFGVLQMNWCFLFVVEVSDGWFWFVIDNGLAWFDLYWLWCNELLFLVYICGLVVDGKFYVVDVIIVLLLGMVNLWLDYIVLSLMMFEWVNFCYWFDGLDSNWCEVGIWCDVSYIYFGLGCYIFYVIVSNNDGVWNMCGVQMVFEIWLVFYQIGWFLLLCIVVGVGVVLLMLWLCIEQI